MTNIQALVLGAIQGLTEFLPVSSSGHLVLVQNLFKLIQPPVTFDILVHVATLFSVIVFFRQELFSLNQNTFKSIIIATIPTGIIGLFLNPFKDALFNSIPLVSMGLLITTILLISIKFLPRAKEIVNITTTQALLIGLAQGLAIIPGISRSGATIIAALWLGLGSTRAFTFSFLISIPAILAAQTLQLNDTRFDLTQLLSTSSLIGAFSALLVGLLALKLLKNTLIKKRLYLFAIYTATLSISSLLVASLLKN